jgi:hypothetical protein
MLGNGWVGCRNVGRGKTVARKGTICPPPIPHPPSFRARILLDGGTRWEMAFEHVSKTWRDG